MRADQVTAIFALGALAACSRGPLTESPLLRLDDQIVPRAEFEQHLLRIEDRDGPVPDAVRETLLQSFLEERVLVLEARARGLVETGATAEDERAAVERLLAQDVLPSVSIPDERVRSYYEAHGEELSSPETITLRQILVPTLNEARDVRRRLHKDRRSFEQLARTRSRSPEAANGGLMGTFERGQLPPELEEAGFGLKPGQIGSIIETPLGFHVLRVDTRTEAKERTLEECREEIRNELFRKEYAAAVQRYVAALLERAEVNR
jgi:peptidyl-prolyl cis-trans isomerase C